MGLGKALGIMLTQKIKCDNCGAVLADGTINTRPPQYAKDTNTGRYLTDINGERQRINNYGDGIGILSVIKYGSKDRVLCDYCLAEEQEKKERQEMVSAISAELSKANAEQAEQAALLQENLRLQNELLKQQLNNAAISNANPAMPNAAVPRANAVTPNINNNVPTVKRANNFCSKCGNALKPNAKFCTKCGAKFN